MPYGIQAGDGKAETMKYTFFGGWLVAASTIDRIFESGGARMTFVIAMAVIVLSAWAMGKTTK